MPQSLPLVSVIVPTYKRLPYLAQTVRSILQQQYSALELLVIADGHDQEVADFVSSLADNRASYLASPHAGRPSVPRNVGIAQAKGDYIAFCDDDDLWETEKLQKQVDLMTRGEAGFSFTGSFDIDQNGALISEFNPASFNDRISKTDFLLSLGGMIPNSSIVVSREVLEKSGPLNESTGLRAMEDYEICSRFLIHTDAVGIVEPLVGYRNHQGSIQPQSITDWLQSQGRLQSAIKANGSAPRWIWSLRYLRVFYWALRLALGQGKFEFARWHDPSGSSH
jgi:teichuronic acid biosynthesis glycosyltransferase TuaG